MRFFDYARVPTSRQALDLQIAALHTEGVESRRTFIDTAGGGDPNERPRGGRARGSEMAIR